MQCVQQSRDPAAGLPCHGRLYICFQTVNPLSLVSPTSCRVTVLRKVTTRGIRHKPRSAEMGFRMFLRWKENKNEGKRFILFDEKKFVLIMKRVKQTLNHES